LLKNHLTFVPTSAERPEVREVVRKMTETYENARILRVGFVFGPREEGRGEEEEEDVVAREGSGLDDLDYM
jgi:hypothetical protein